MGRMQELHAQIRDARGYMHHPTRRSDNGRRTVQSDRRKRVTQLSGTPPPPPPSFAHMKRALDLSSLAVPVPTDEARCGVVTILWSDHAASRARQKLVHEAAVERAATDTLEDARRHLLVFQRRVHELVRARRPSPPLWKRTAVHFDDQLVPKTIAYHVQTDGCVRPERMHPAVFRLRHEHRLVD